MNATEKILDRIPNEQEVRKQLAENLREAAVLRSLLRIAKKKTDADGHTQQGEAQANA